MTVSLKSLLKIALLGMFALLLTGCGEASVI